MPPGPGRVRLCATPVAEKLFLRGPLARTSGLTLDAASPMISIERISASAKTRSRSRSPHWRPVPNSVASRAASSMWRKRTTSLGGILNGGCTQNLIAEISA